MGLFVYLADREASRAWLVPAVTALAGGHWFGTLGQWLPSLVHPFAFGLLSAALLPPQGAARPAACVAWAVVNALFEWGQHPRASAWIARSLQEWDGPPALTQPLASYFQHGSFDPGDLAAAAIGALLAIGVLRLVQGLREHDLAQ